MATSSDWQGRARREAAALIAVALPNEVIADYEQTLTLVALGWLEGVNVGSHETLGMVADTFDVTLAAL